MEWSSAAKYNSFNGFKGLTYYENYKAILRWMDGDSYLPSPVEVNLDPIAECNLACYFCVGQRYLRDNRVEVGPMRKLPTDYMLRLVDYLAEWGVRGLCISGGGEPSLHEGIPAVINQAAHRGMDVALVSNVVAVSPELAEAIMHCRWLAMSVDAADAETYQTVKGRDSFASVVSNISRLVALREQTRSKVDLAFKMLILSENTHGIFQACRLARDLGVQDFHVRPADLERPDVKNHGKRLDDLSRVREQLEMCHELETDSFHVYTVTHKFDGAFRNQQNFSRCLMTPLLLPILTDGNVYMCVDKKMQDAYRLASCFPDPEAIGGWWGSNGHRDAVKTILPAVHCAENRCTGQCYNEQMEQVVLQDRMCLSFP